MIVAGVDGWQRRWVTVELVDGEFHGAYIADTLAEIAARKQYEVIGIDVPIGLVDTPPRAADRAARLALGIRRSSVFDAPPAFCLSSDIVSYSDANKKSKQRLYRGISAQAFALMNNIREADALALVDDRIYEVHPELSYAAMNGDQPMAYSKKSWNGTMQRIAALERHGIHLSNLLEGESTGRDAGRAGTDDVLDAAAVAWSANRIAMQAAVALPDTNSRRERIWY